MDALAVAQVAGMLMGFWGSGYLIGLAVSWVRKIVSVA